MSALRQAVIGEHTATLEPPDLLVLTFRGVIRAPHVAAYAALRTELLADQRYLLTLADLRRVEGVEPACRRSIAAIRDERAQATAFVGGSFRFRVVAELIANAARVFAHRKLAFRFFPDEASARSWLTEMRRTLRGA
ncbi:hypothetical protein [Polyangium jinanense]|uniref:STAS/SEC14 domain-containing protein n=1 Tax=Polyangium jinanense TaxID=2829994 RepID=A0A9X3X5K5_9BACT|nr:hypothetical protein [Polyangium jinanense]MDC3959060.1 hypothetical protein [Polyangium jinanense]MDC3984017.1 hypothetical protein [Polyangium jinanense]